MAANDTNDITPEDEEIYVELDLDEGTVKCSIITIFSAMGKDYIALQPLDENGENEDGDVWIYGYREDPDHPEEDPEIIYIEDDEEYEIASDAYDEYLDNKEFDELIGDDDDDDGE